MSQTWIRGRCCWCTRKSYRFIQRIIKTCRWFDYKSVNWRHNANLFSIIVWYADDRVTSPMCAETPEELKQNRSTKRFHILKELINTEGDFLKNLNIIIDDIMITLSERKVQCKRRSWEQGCWIDLKISWHPISLFPYCSTSIHKFSRKRHGF